MKRLYIDCDGVLADFDGGFERMFGMPPKAYEEMHGIEEFWRAIRHARPGFYLTLRLLPETRELMTAVSDLRPIILTGCPRGGWAETQKLRWARKHFPGIPMVTCMASDKRLYCQPGDVLVDDLEKYRHLWEKAGGKFILHRDVPSTMRQINASFWRERLVGWIKRRFR
jgi:hypothetical protein